MKQTSPNYISYRDLPPMRPDSPLTVEYDLYRKEVGRLLAEGHAGRWILIKNAEMGIWDTRDEAMTAAYNRFVGQDFFVQQILEWERVYRAPWAKTC